MLQELYSSVDYERIITELKSTCPDLLYGVVYYNHIIKLQNNFQPTRDHLHTYFERGAMLLLRSGTTGNVSKLKLNNIYFLFHVFRNDLMLYYCRCRFDHNHCDSC